MMNECRFVEAENQPTNKRMIDSSDFKYLPVKLSGKMFLEEMTSAVKPTKQSHSVPRRRFLPPWLYLLCFCEHDAEDSFLSFSHV